MAKIHTHYDNLKVARLAPPEVIRAAYKALSQKYHPDKNPDDEKAARIMAILNSAYGTLSDPQRRCEHDEWIAAEEWEIEWLESTGADEQRERAPAHVRTAERVENAPAYRVSRDPRWWIGMLACLALGCVAGLLANSQSKGPGLVTAQPGKSAAAGVVPNVPSPAAPAEPQSEAAIDGWAIGKPYVPASEVPPQPDTKAFAITQLVIPATKPDCDTDLQTLLAPNGEPWPAKSGYVEGYPIGNKGSETQLKIDNSANRSGVFVKVFDLDRRSNVRHLFVQAHEAITVEELAVGKYEVRYQNVDIGAGSAECPGRKKHNK